MEKKKPFSVRSGYSMWEIELFILMEKVRRCIFVHFPKNNLKMLTNWRSYRNEGKKTKQPAYAILFKQFWKCLFYVLFTVIWEWSRTHIKETETCRGQIFFSTNLQTQSLEKVVTALEINPEAGAVATCVLFTISSWKSQSNWRRSITIIKHCRFFFKQKPKKFTDFYRYAYIYDKKKEYL